MSDKRERNIIALVGRGNDLENAIKGIVAAWETGDLAAAVNSARALVEPEEKGAVDVAGRRAMTIVGTYPDTGGESYVEHVWANSARHAIAEAVGLDPARDEGWIVAVFEGHLTDIGPEAQGR